MEEPFKILVVDENSFENHIGEECNDLKEVVVNPTRRNIQTYTLLFRGIIRSIYHDSSKLIEVVIDVESDLYNNMFEQLKETMQAQEKIDFEIRRK